MGITENNYFLPYFITEDIYIDNTELIEIKSQPINNEPIVAPIIEAKPQQANIEPPKVIKSPLPPTPFQPIIQKTQIITEPKINQPEKIFLKAIVMVGYQGAIPKEVSDSINKTLLAVPLNLSDFEIINALDPNAKPIDQLDYKYLLLMGGNGKSIEWLKSYTGTRNRYDIAKHNNRIILFAEAMDIYLKDREIGKKFWLKVKEMFTL
ncbi:MAG: hypothetical protein SFY32_06110 [Bacteroidota bacterium]|nr:hypothetical protein [Bacteroidota bacterium]